jgi:DNA-binding response OmpR family regulator
MLTARTQEADKLAGLSGGADDYVTKPFSPSELVARVTSLCRRVELSGFSLQNEKRESITHGKFTLHLRQRYLKKEDKMIELTHVEFQILECLFQSFGKPMTRGEILHRVWGDAYFGEEKIVDVNIRRLRMKIEEDPSNPIHLVTMWGKGYKWQS